jgi:inner membrane transporter RhtA
MLAGTSLTEARSRARALRPPATALVATSAMSTQFGAAIATRLFPEVGPAGTLTLRLVFAAVALVAVVRPRPRSLLRARRADLAVVLGFGLVLAGMNLSFYEAIDRVPLGVAVTLEFAGPLTLSVVTSRRWVHVVWALLAGAGVFLLAGGDLLGAAHLDAAGVGFALLAGALWAFYILLNKQTGARFDGTSGLAWAMIVAAVIVSPLGAVDAGVRLFRPEILGAGLGVAVLSSALPYSCEMAALRRVTPRAFGILLSMAPALAALAGLVVLGQRLGVAEVAALVLVVAANVGSSWTGATASTSAPAVAALDSVDSVEMGGSPSAGSGVTEAVLDAPLTSDGTPRAAITTPHEDTAPDEAGASRRP